MADDPTKKKPEVKRSGQQQQNVRFRQQQAKRAAAPGPRKGGRTKKG